MPDLPVSRRLASTVTEQRRRRPESKEKSTIAHWGSIEVPLLLHLVLGAGGVSGAVLTGSAGGAGPAARAPAAAAARSGPATAARAPPRWAPPTISTPAGWTTDSCYKNTFLDFYHKNNLTLKRSMQTKNSAAVISTVWKSYSKSNHMNHKIQYA